MFSNTVSAKGRSSLPPSLAAHQPSPTWPSFPSWFGPGSHAIWHSAEATVTQEQSPLILLHLGMRNLWVKAEFNTGSVWCQSIPINYPSKGSAAYMSYPSPKFAFSSGFSVNPVQGHYGVSDLLVPWPSRQPFSLSSFISPFFILWLFCSWQKSLSKQSRWLT